MKINEILTESIADEGIGDAVRGIARGIGAVPGAITQMGSEMKTGYNSGRNWVAGKSTPGGSSVSGRGPGRPPSANTQQVAQLNQAISSMTVKDLKKLQKNINDTIQLKSRPRVQTPSTPGTPNP
jgi:transposase